MGGFRVKIAPGYFTKVLDSNPDVHLLWDHNTRYVLARTRNNSLELREDPMGLHVWARFAKTQTADELATLMDGGYIDQMSFATDVGVSEWTEDSDGNLTWHLLEADPVTGLTDVTVCAQGAFPQTDASLVASLNNAGALLASALRQGTSSDVTFPTSSRLTGRAGKDTVSPSLALGCRRRRGQRRDARE
jgi:HK97 family phage prohead protease